MPLIIVVFLLWYNFYVYIYIHIYILNRLVNGYHHSPPAKETPHLQGRVPPPSEQQLIEMFGEMRLAEAPAGRKLLQTLGAQVGGEVMYPTTGMLNTTYIVFIGL